MSSEGFFFPADRKMLFSKKGLLLPSLHACVKKSCVINVTCVVGTSSLYAASACESTTRGAPVHGTLNTLANRDSEDPLLQWDGRMFIGIRDQLFAIDSFKRAQVYIYSVICTQCIRCTHIHLHTCYTDSCIYTYVYMCIQCVCSNTVFYFSRESKGETTK